MVVAFVFNVVTPYRAHLNRRIQDELKFVHPIFCYTHQYADQPWDEANLREKNSFLFGSGETANEKISLRYLNQSWKKGGSITKILEGYKPTAIFISGYADPVLLRLFVWAWIKGIPFFIIGDSNVYGDSARGFKLLLKRIYLKFLLRAASAALPCGTAGVAYFNSYGPPKKLFLCPYEPDYEQLSRAQTFCKSYEAEPIILNSERRRFVVCARLEKLKRIDLAITAFCRLADDRPDWDLIIVGGGTLRKSLESMVPSRLRGRVIFTGFIGDQSVIFSIYSRSHILLVTSEYEPWGVVVNEALAAGMAVVASHITGAAIDLIQHGVNGFRFQSGDADELEGFMQEASSTETLHRLSASSTVILSRWRAIADPVAGIRNALLSTTVNKIN